MSGGRRTWGAAWALGLAVVVGGCGPRAAGPGGSGGGAGAGSDGASGGRGTAGAGSGGTSGGRGTAGAGTAGATTAAGDAGSGGEGRVEIWASYGYSTNTGAIWAIYQDHVDEEYCTILYFDGIQVEQENGLEKSEDWLHFLGGDVYRVKGCHLSMVGGTDDWVAATWVDGKLRWTDPSLCSFDLVDIEVTLPEGPGWWPARDHLYATDLPVEGAPGCDGSGTTGAAGGGP